MSAESYAPVSDQDLRTMTTIAVTRKLKGNCAAFSRIAGVSSALVTSLVNRSRFPVEAPVRHRMYTAAIAVIEGRIQVRPASVRRSVHSPEGTLPGSMAGTPKPRPLEISAVLSTASATSQKSPTPTPRSIFSEASQVAYEPLARAFCQANVLLDPSYRVRTAALYTRYTEWHQALVEDGSTLPPLLSAQKFGAFIRLVHSTITTGASRGPAWGREYLGVCLKPLPTEIVPDSLIPDSARPFQDPPQAVHEMVTEILRSADIKPSGLLVPWTSSPTTLASLQRLEDMAMELALAIEALKTQLQGE